MGEPDEVVVVAVALAGVGVANGISVFSNSGVVVYVMRSPTKASELLGNGSSDTAVALGKATRWDAGTSGSSEARSKGASGFRTLRVGGWLC